MKIVYSYINTPHCHLWVTCQVFGEGARRAGESDVGRGSEATQRDPRHNLGQCPRQVRDAAGPPGIGPCRRQTLRPLAIGVVLDAHRRSNWRGYGTGEFVFYFVFFNIFFIIIIFILFGCC